MSFEEVNILNNIIAIGIIILGISSLLLSLELFGIKILPKKIKSFMTKNLLWIGFSVSLGAMAFSMIYSTVVGYPPCDLCWYQRIFMYPLVFIFGMMALKKEYESRGLWVLGRNLSFVGITIAIYQNLITWFDVSSICSSGSDCTKLLVNSFGFVTIPLMSFVGFLFLIVLFYWNKNFRSSLG
ncbi:disulfide bond formation protein B [Candidatus Nomurabacteria bacterium]|nr:disulfide bond formation protein B [Candidatus Nomurabacteria bacterium]USN94649.1 MAG: disulfide bond formation protein B [Candidatus Nomurabacteria bacterium]